MTMYSQARHFQPPKSDIFEKPPFISSKSISSKTASSSRTASTETCFTDALNIELFNAIIGDNSIAVNQFLKELRSLGYDCISNLGYDLQGEARILGEFFADEWLTSGRSCLGGGETTVKVTNPSGKGGRNQEMVLAFLIRASEKLVQFEGETGKREYCFFSFGTDGQDGPTDAAGACVDSYDVEELQKNVNVYREAKEALRMNNSYSLGEYI